MKMALSGAALVCTVFAQLAGADTLRTELLEVPLFPALGGAATVDRADSQAFKQMAANAGGTRFPQFMFGQRQFVSEWDPAPGQVPDQDGLGPTFNAVACASCHINNGRGRPPLAGEEFDSILVRLSIPGSDIHGGPLSLTNYGGQLQHRAIEGVPAEGTASIRWEEQPGTFADGAGYSLRKPILVFSDLAYGPLPPDTLTSLRVANPVIGLGLLESIPAANLLALADPDDENNDGISGRINTVWDSKNNLTATGRFGWKANVATVELQNAGAALGDMGVTTALNPVDNCPPVQIECIEAAAAHPDDPQFRPEFFAQLTRYVRLLAVPAQRNAADVQVLRGQVLFYTAGCVQCHMPTQRTGANDEFPELANQTIHPFTDLLLHDMGPGLADGRPDYGASGSEWRTAPLWGIGLTNTVGGGHANYLHDGRARNLSEAILWHGGEAEVVKQSFRSMSAANREALIAFLQSL